MSNEEPEAAGDAAGMSDVNRWVALTRENPGHSQWYIDRFRQMAEAGDDLVGEARMIDAMVPRGSRILDAGCGPGRVGAHLALLGHDVIGVDLDPQLIDAARHDHPETRWIVADLATFDPAEHGITDHFDAIVAAGNVMAFLAPSTRRSVLERLGACLRGDGRLVTGFGAGRDYPFDAFFADVAAAGLAVDLALSTWDLRPFTGDSEFLVAVLRLAR